MSDTATCTDCGHVGGPDTICDVFGPVNGKGLLGRCIDRAACWDRCPPLPPLSQNTMVVWLEWEEERLVEKQARFADLTMAARKTVEWSPARRRYVGGWPF